MKSGISLVEMAQEIQRQNDLKADYMLDTRSLRLEPFGGGLYLNAYDQPVIMPWSRWRSTPSHTGRSERTSRSRQPIMTRCWRNTPSCWRRM